MYVYHSWLNILDTNNAFHSGTILKIDGLNIRMSFFPLWDWVNTVLSWVNTAGMKRKCLRWTGTFCLSDASSFSSLRQHDQTPVTSMTPPCLRSFGESCWLTLDRDQRSCSGFSVGMFIWLMPLAVNRLSNTGQPRLHCGSVPVLDQDHHARE